MKKKVDRPNVLLLMTDQHRGDCLGIENHPVLQTPYLDEIGRQGFHFRKGYTACPVCIPARRTLMTGQKPSSHGVLMNYNTWLDGFKFKRNKEKEDDLFYNKLGLKDDDAYALVNNIFTIKHKPSPMSLPKINIKKVNVSIIKGFNVLDWSKVIEKASQIHVIDTSFTFLIERLNTCKDLNLYPRNHVNSNSYQHTRYLWTKNWKYK